jgi:hypothetical protein
MPLVYVHGVANRVDKRGNLESFRDYVEPLLRRYVAPVLRSDPQNAIIRLAYWGDEGVKFAWNGDSRPRSVLLGQGAAAPVAVAERSASLAALPDTRSVVRSAPAAASAPPGLIAAGPQGGGSERPQLKTLDPDGLSDLIAAFIGTGMSPGADQSAALIAADDAARDPVVRTALAAAPDLSAEIEVLQKAVDSRMAARGGLIAQGAGPFSKVMDTVRETVSRVANAPGAAVSTALLELRRPLNNLVTLFSGDVFVYLMTRADSAHPGKIPSLVMQALDDARAAEPNEAMVVLSHSMGGQIIYDLVTHFLPAKAGGRIDFWAATASQVGLFEEEKLFLASASTHSAANTNKAPFPDRKYLGGWWNVWDSNDVMSYTADPIFDGVDDESYSSGVSLIQAHGEYLQRPSFYRRFAAKLTLAKQANWNRI